MWAWQIIANTVELLRTADDIIHILQNSTP